MPEQPDPIVAIGASAGGVEALCTLIGNLPADFPGAILIVLHAGAGTESQLPRILNRCGNLPAEHVNESLDIQAGRVYVARPNQHLVVEPGRVGVDHGPRVDSYRPSINRLFESAADAYGSRVTGVVLSGALHDGTFGLMMIKQAGGIAIVQEPDDALFSGMPQSALDNVDIDFRGTTAEIAGELMRLAGQRSGTDPERASPDQRRHNPDSQNGDPEHTQLPEVAGFACPECGGVLREKQIGNLTRYRCHVGHELSESALLNAQGEHIEQALWTALRVLEERIQLVQRAANRARERGNNHVADHFLERNREANQSAEVIRRVLHGDDQHPPVSMLQTNFLETDQAEHKRQYDESWQ